MYSTAGQLPLPCLNEHPSSGKFTSVNMLNVVNSMWCVVSKGEFM